MADEMLSQEEIDALIKAVQEPGAQAVEEEEEKAEPVAAEAAAFSPEEPAVEVQAAQFPPLTEDAPVPSSAQGRIDFLLEVPLSVTVELGRARRKLREVLTLNAGSVLQLDKLAGEAVDVLINGRPVAKGEVVVIDENFGVRITEIKSPAERVHHLT
ncbi:MAG: flagellar motor switch protein FliN [Thermaerobacter sp.]|nr:flagellar motor switch protein FliN [Thermaerobacter sp.]